MNAQSKEAESGSVNSVRSVAFPGSNTKFSQPFRPGPRGNSGFVAFYGLVLLIILGIYLSGVQFLALDQSLHHRLAVYEAQARQAADAGMEVCLWIASTSSAIGPVEYLLLFPAGGPASSALVVLRTSRGAPPTFVSQAQVTASVFDRNATSTASPWVSRRTLTNSIDVNARRFLNSWSR